MRRSVELSFDVIARATGARSFGAAPLDHESFDDPVKDQPIVESTLGQAQEVFDVAGRHLGQELEPNGTFTGDQFSCVFFRGEV